MHHLHYETLGHESLADVQVLCQDCHRLADAGRKKAGRSGSGESKWAGRDAVHNVGVKIIRVPGGKKNAPFKDSPPSSKALARKSGAQKSRLGGVPDRVVKQLAKKGDQKALRELQRRLKRGRIIPL